MTLTTANVIEICGTLVPDVERHSLEVADTHAATSLSPTHPVGLFININDSSYYDAVDAVASAIDPEKVKALDKATQAFGDAVRDHVVDVRTHYGRAACYYGVAIGMRIAGGGR